ncbi:unnamed protein product [Blepharisma stoltei]|uniref:Kinesin motor domain-containing protein n=1 Tax=Blepharisma stoltei TaxID=1481888 RepID=A0AAU9KGL2_9CILI|nr:unnamed protein product [Blepharisma stoltei]
MKSKDRIRVCIRSRPLFSQDSKDAFIYSSSSIQLKQSISNVPSSYTFDNVFDSQTATSEVYDTVCKEIIEGAIEGYNGTILAYGQTTSGKTHTIIGNPESPGILSLTFIDIFNIIQSKRREFTILVSYLEVYNEIINDLLDPGSINLRIREDPTEGYFVSGLKQLVVRNPKEAVEILEFGEKQRRYRATNIHEHSSRSHTVFRILIESKDIDGLIDDGNEIRIKGNMRFSVLNLVDLAGSERIGDVGNTDTSETSHINKSLFVLANVINKLADNPNAHIPFRDSKLTRILSNSLGGNALTAIICTIAPEINNVQLSISTLRFATRAKSIKNQPIINEVIDDSKLITGYKNKIARLEAQISSIITSKDKEISKLKEENAKLRELSMNTPEKQDKEQVIKFVNVSEQEFYEKYKELQKNFNIQISIKHSLMKELGDIKELGIIGFDIQKRKFDKENTKEVAELSSWESECLKLRNNYLIELAALDENYWDHLSELFARLRGNKTSQDRKPPIKTEAKSRPTTNVQPKRSRPISQENVRIRYKVGNTYKNQSPTSLNPAKKDTPRSSQKVMTPIPSNSSENRNAYPSPFKLVCEDLADTPKPTNVRKSTDDPSSLPRKAITLESESSSDEVALNSEEEQKYNPPPNLSPPTESINSVPSDLKQGGNVILFGMNRDGSCAGKNKYPNSSYNYLEHEYSEIISGYYHNAVIDKQGVLRMFGNGNLGQLGNVNLNSTFTPQLVSHPLREVPISMVACGWLHTICVTKTGQVFTWGFNGDGQLGLGDFYDRSWPVMVNDMDSVNYVAAGYLHSACIKNGELYMWGANPDGRLFKQPMQIKHKVFRKERSPIKIVEISNVVEIALGVSHSLALTSNGDVYTCGSTDHGQLGMGANYEVYSALFKIPLFGYMIKAAKIKCGDGYSAILDSQKHLYTFGKGTYGRLGLGHDMDVLTPELVSKTLQFIDISCGGRHMMGIDINGETYAWGYGFYFQLGTMSQEDSMVPICINLSSTSGRWAGKISCGYYHSAIQTL